MRIIETDNQPKRPRPIRRWSTFGLVLGCVLAGAASSGAGATSPPAPSPSPSPSSEPTPAGSEPGDQTTVGEDEVRVAKAGLGWFLLANVDRPTRVADPCPTLPIESVAWYLDAAGGLVTSQRPYGVAVVWDTEVAGGLVAVRCGMDLDQSPEPEGSVGWSLDVAMLDGQATFAQYAVAVGGRDVLIDQMPELRAQLASTCNDNGTRCTAALEIDDLLLTLRLRGLPDESGETIVRDLVVTIAREVVANLGAVPPPS